MKLLPQPLSGVEAREDNCGCPYCYLFRLQNESGNTNVRTEGFWEVGAGVYAGTWAHSQRAHTGQETWFLS